MFLSTDFLWEYWIELVAIELACIKFTFPTRVIIRGVSDLVTGSVVAELDVHIFSSPDEDGDVNSYSANVSVKIRFLFKGNFSTWILMG